MITAELIDYIEAEILPRYDAFDKGHGRDHALTVIEQSLELAGHYSVNHDIVYAAAAYHDTGLCEGRELHHMVSARIVREDKRLREFFSPKEIDIIADAVEDHRASNSTPPRTIYGRIVAEADRIIDPHTIMTRTVQFGLAHYPTLTKEEHLERAVQHLKEKYGRGGYLKLWIPESDNAARLAELRSVAQDKTRLRELFDRLFNEEM